MPNALPELQHQLPQNALKKGLNSIIGYKHPVKTHAWS
jgi:hypothetical protein